jgi:antitoxin component YwqK of YwqJK toxin-antitoxin module
MIIRVLYLICIAAFLHSCKNRKSKVEVIETYPNGAVKLTHTPKNDSVYFREEYFENGNHKTAVFVKNNSFDGRWEVYTIDDKMQEYGDYKDGKKVGVWKYNIYEQPANSKFIEYLPNGDSIVNIKFY